MWVGLALQVTVGATHPPPPGSLAVPPHEPGTHSVVSALYTTWPPGTNSNYVCPGVCITKI